MAYTIPRNLLELLDAEHVVKYAPDGKRKFFTPLQVSWVLGCSNQTICAWVRQGRIPCENRRGRLYDFTRGDIATMAENGLMPIGYYKPCEKGEGKRLDDLKRANKRKSKGMRGGAK